MKWEGDIITANRGERLDQFLAKMVDRSRSVVQGWLREGRVTVRPLTKPATASYRLRMGDEVEMSSEPVEEKVDRPQGEDIPLQIVHEDKSLIVINKPPGLVVHPAVGHLKGTLVNALVHHCGAALAGRGGEDRLGLVHRLDKDTSGLIIIAKTDKAHELLGQQFADRIVQKKYLALCRGVFRHKQGSCKDPIGRHRTQRQKMAVLTRGGKEAHTDYRVLHETPLASWVECTLHTGRTHQIRVHMTHHGHPILGDLLYGRQLEKKTGIVVPRQMLHATQIGFNHPRTGKPVEYRAEPPADFLLCWQQIQKQSAS